MSSDKIVIVGAGEQGEIAWEYFTHDSPHEVVAFAVEREYLDGDTGYEGTPVVALEDLPRLYPPAEYKTFVALSSHKLNRLRARLFRQVKDMGYTCASYVSSRAFVWRNAKIGENCMIFEDNVIQHFVEVGDDVVMWSGNHVGHRTKIGDHVFVSSHCVISGYCEIGDYSFLGVNSCFGDGLKVAADNVIGAGAVIVRDTEPRKVYVGNPAKPVKDSFVTFGVVEEAEAA
jgi:sugar O-acyltransferase (sialic acid O-acetyltransferase NeuD family)